MKYAVIYTYEIHQIHITYYWVSAYNNIVVISTWNYSRYTSHITWLMHINIVVILLHEFTPYAPSL